MVRDLDLKKPPSIAESIDWARALLLLGADDIDAEMFRDTMSVIVKHRTDLDVVAERVGVKLVAGPDGLRASRHRLATRRVRRGAARRGRRRRDVELLDAFAVLARSRWTEPGGLPRGAGRDAREVARGPAHLRARLRPLLLPRRRGRGGRGAACSEADGGAGRAARTATSIEPRQLREQIAAGAARRRRGRAARPRAAGDRRVRPAGRGLGRHRRRRAAHPPRARPALRAAAATCPRTTRAATALPRDQLRRFEELLRRELERAQIERTETLPPARPLNELDRALPRGPLQDLAAVHRVVAQLKRRLKTQGQESRGRTPPRARRRAPHDARVAGDRRRPRRAAVPPAAAAAAGDLRALRRLDLA